MAPLSVYWGQLCSVWSDFIWFNLFIWLNLVRSRRQLDQLDCINRSLIVLIRRHRWIDRFEWVWPQVFSLWTCDVSWLLLTNRLNVVAVVVAVAVVLLLARNCGWFRPERQRTGRRSTNPTPLALIWPVPATAPDSSASTSTNTTEGKTATANYYPVWDCFGFVECGAAETERRPS